ncbi:MAG: nuclear transport factor 2 family protein [Pseudomonadota bacterium]
MSDEHPNISVLKRFNPSDVAASVDVLSEDAVFHYINPEWPEMEGDYTGRVGFLSFFTKIAESTNGTFKVNPISATPLGDELVVAHVRNTMTFPDRRIELEAVVLWRIADGRIAEGWDIPVVNAANITNV